MSTDIKSRLDKIAERKPTRCKRDAIAEGRPWIPDCEHPGCTLAAQCTLGHRSRAKFLCRLHLSHESYRLLRAISYSPLVVFESKAAEGEVR